MDEFQQVRALNVLERVATGRVITYGSSSVVHASWDIDPPLTGYFREPSPATLRKQELRDERMLYMAEALQESGYIKVSTIEDDVPYKVRNWRGKEVTRYNSVRRVILTVKGMELLKQLRNGGNHEGRERD